MKKEDARPSSFAVFGEKEGISVKIWMLMENTACREGFLTEHGLSLYLETGSRRILFDMGQSDAFLSNAAGLGVNLSTVDTAILSHGHYDHGGGMEAFFRCNHHAKLYLSRYAFQPHYNRKGKYIGLDPALQGHPQLVFAEDCPLGDGLSLYSCNALPRLWDADPCGLAVEENGIRLPEDFRHEQYLLVQEGDRRILISGCSHKGIVNLVHWFRPDVLVGGFHLKDIPAESPEIERLARTLLQYRTVYFTGHCTGEDQYMRLKQYMGERLHTLRAGMVLEV